MCVASCVTVFSVSVFVVFFKQKTAYEMRISDWSSDVCSSDLHGTDRPIGDGAGTGEKALRDGRRQPRIDHQRLVAADEQGAIGRALDRKSVVLGKRVSDRVDLGGRRILKKKIESNYTVTRER